MGDRIGAVGMLLSNGGVVSDPFSNPNALGIQVVLSIGGKDAMGWATLASVRIQLVEAKGGEVGGLFEKCGCR